MKVEKEMLTDVRDIYRDKYDVFVTYPKGLKGKNDNKLVAYQHIRTLGEKYSKHEGGLATAKVSDFDRAQKCTTCERDIVHVYWVKNAKGKIMPYGQEHLHEALGYKKALNKSQIQSLRMQLSEKQQLEKVREEELIERAEGANLTEANQRFLKLGYRAEDIKKSVLYVDDKGNHIRVSPEYDNDEEILQRLGFKKKVLREYPEIKKPC